MNSQYILTAFSLNPQCFLIELSRNVARESGDNYMKMWRNCGVNLALMSHSHQIWIIIEFTCTAHQIRSRCASNSQ